MDYTQAVILAIIQGVTEFLPISSSAHLILPKEILGWQDQGLAFDTSVHLGTLFAVIIAFRKTLLALLQNLFYGLSANSRVEKRQIQLIINLIIATIPAGILGLLLADFIEENLRSAWVIASTTIIFGLFLWWANKQKNTQISLYDISWKVALIIGLAQALALIPGTSRSGITITAALFLGMARKDSAEFSFLMSIPIIVAAGLLESIKLYKFGINMDLGILLIAVLLSFVTAFLTIKFFLHWIEKLGLLPFVVYRLVLGLALFAFLF